MSGYDNQRRNFRRNDPEYLIKKAEKLKLQTANLEMIAKAAEYLDDIIQTKPTTKLADGRVVETQVRMKDLVEYLENAGYAVEDTKVISQLNYIMLELANARMNSRVSGDRLNIRVLYFQERLKTSYKKELRGKIDDILNKYNYLFYWDDESTGDEYEIISTGVED